MLEPLNGAIQKYTSSDEETKDKYYKEYCEMKKYCNEYCNTVILKSINPRIKWEDKIQIKIKF